MAVSDLDFFIIKQGTYRSGLYREDIEDICSRFPEADEKFLLNSSPPLDFNLSADINISRRLVTAAEFETFVSATGYATLAETEGWGWLWSGGWIRQEGISWRTPFKSPLDRKYNSGMNYYPAFHISWIDAVAYCSWLSQNSKFIFSLPDEFIWEQAAKEFLFDEDMLGVKPAEDNNIFLEAMELHCKNSGRHPAGLLWEWTDSWFEGYDKSAGNREFGNTYRVLRGGSLFSEGWQRIPQYRFRRCPTARSPYYGFRTASVYRGLLLTTF